MLEEDQVGFSISVTSQITNLTIVYSTVYSGADKKKTPKLRVTVLCEGNSPVTGEFPAQRASNAMQHDVHLCTYWYVREQHDIVTLVWVFQYPSSLRRGTHSFNVILWANFCRWNATMHVYQHFSCHICLRNSIRCNVIYQHVEVQAKWSTLENGYLKCTFFNENISTMTKFHLNESRESNWHSLLVQVMVCHVNKSRCQIIIWPNGDHILWCHMVSLGYNEWKIVNCNIPKHVYIIKIEIATQVL